MTINKWLSLLMVFLMAATAANAVDGTWTGISGNWSDTTTPGGVWTNGIPADGAGFTANFTGVNITAAQTITLDANRTIGNITFTDSATLGNDLTISGANVLTLDRIDATQPTINVVSRTLTISSQISGTNGLQKIGAGTLALSGDNDYTGTTTINAGNLSIAHNNALGSTAGNTTIAATGSTSTGGQLQLANAITSPENITITGSTEISGFAAAILGSPGMTVTLSGNITLSSLTGGIRFATYLSASKMTFAGPISQVGSGQALVCSHAPSGGQWIAVNNPIANNGGALIITGNGGSTILKGVNATDGSGIGNTTINSGGPTLQLGVSDALNTVATLTVNGNFNLANYNQTVNVLSGSGIVQNTIAGTNTLTVGNGGGTGTFNGVVQTGIGQVALTKTGAGTQTLTGINTYSGPTLINEGTLVGVVGGSCTNSAVTVTNTATLAISVTNNTMQWACASLTLNNGSQLMFNFTATPSPTLAPLMIPGNLTFSGTSTIEVVSATRGTYPLLTVTGTVDGAKPTVIGGIGSLTWIGNTLWLIPSGTVITVR